MTVSPPVEIDQPSARNHSGRSDVAVDVAVRARFTISGRAVVEKVKWAAIGAGLVTCLLWIPHIDVKSIPTSTDPTVALQLSR